MGGAAIDMRPMAGTVVESRRRQPVRRAMTTRTHMIHLGGNRFTHHDGVGKPVFHIHQAYLRSSPVKATPSVIRIQALIEAIVVAKPRAALVTHLGPIALTTIGIETAGRKQALRP